MARDHPNRKAGLTAALVLCLAACAGLMSPAGCGRTTVPDALEGTWVTAAPSMEGRYLKLSGRLLVFGRGEHGKSVHAIRRIKSKRKDARETGYVFHYVGEGGEKRTLVLFHNPASGGTIRLRNRTEIWRRITTGGTV